MRHSRIILYILIFFTCVSAGMVWYTYRLEQNVLESSALHNAEFFADTIGEFRALYTSEIVYKALKSGLQLSRDYQKEDAIPLPVTMSKLLGERIGQNGSGAEVKLYSPYPFLGGNTVGGLQDDFSRKAWSRLSDTKAENYYRFVDVDGQRLLRFAVPDRMRKGCLGCHNSHVDSPRKDWQEGELRGVLEVTLPLSGVQVAAADDMKVTIAIYLVLALSAFSAAAYVLSRYRAESRELELAVAERTLAVENERLRAVNANNAKTQFLSRMSHELRTPLNAILGLSQLLELDAKNDEEKKYAVEITNAGNHLLGLISEVLDLTAVDTGQMDIERIPVPVDEVISESIRLVTPIFTQRGIDLHEYEYTGLRVLADRNRLKQVLINLLSNAIKYNKPHGTVQITSLASGNGLIRIRVMDTGPGLGIEQLKRIFFPFERLGAENTGVDGVGIGLALSKQLVEAMNGSIGVESSPGSGSKFWVELQEVT